MPFRKKKKEIMQLNSRIQCNISVFDTDLTPHPCYICLAVTSQILKTFVTPSPQGQRAVDCAIGGSGEVSGMENPLLSRCAIRGSKEVRMGIFTNKK